MRDRAAKLCCVIVAICVIAPCCFSVCKPGINLTKSSELGIPKYIFVSEHTACVQKLPLSACLNSFNLRVITKIFDRWTHSDVLSGADDRSSASCGGERKCETRWQGVWQYCCAGSERNFVSGSKASVNYRRNGLKFQVFLSLLIDGSTDDNTEIGAH